MDYKYKSLPTARSIRNLILSPAEEYTDVIECTIETGEVGVDKYDALSYTWGMEADGCALLNHEIYIEGKRLPITENLFDGLRRIRLRDQFLRIWIDAVCINQQDDAERSSQVAMMADIYAGAEKVLVWLGNSDDENGDLVMYNLLTSIKMRAEQISTWKSADMRFQNCFILSLLGKDFRTCPGCEVYRQARSDGGDLNELVTHVDWLAEVFSSQASTRQLAIDMIELVARFFCRRYWKRRWILQELSLSEEHHWYWGQHDLDMSCFPPNWIEDLLVALAIIEHGFEKELENSAKDESITSDSLLDHVVYSNSFLTRTKGISDLCKSHTVDIGRERTWNSLLNNFFSSECSDPRDTYYALAGMAAVKIRVDYSLSVAQVFQQFAEMMLGKNEWAWVFYYSAENPKREDRQQMNLPSWVPDPRFENWYLGEPLQPMGIKIDQGNSIACDIRCLGLLQWHEQSRSFQIIWDQAFWQICSPQHTADETPQEALAEPLQVQMYGLTTKIKSGDILCSCLENLDKRDLWLVLRVLDLTTQTYELAAVHMASHALPSLIRGDEFEDAHQFAQCPKIKVHII